MKKVREKPFIASLKLLNKRDKKILSSITLIQVGLAIFDLVGVSLIGVLGGMSLQGLQKDNSTVASNQFINFIGISNLSYKTQISILGISAVTTLMLKTFLSIYFTRKTFYYLSKKSASISSELILRILSQNLIDLRKKTSQEIIYNVTDGVKNITMGIIATRITIISDLSLLIVLLSGFYFFDPTIAAFTTLLFVSVGFVLHKLLHNRSRDIGVQLNQLTVKSNQKLIEAINSFREFIVRNRNSYYSNEIRKIRLKLAKVQAELAFQPFITKYVIETVTLVSAMLLAIYEFQTKSVTDAVALLAVFTAATSRMAPAALRIQQGLLIVQASSGSALSTFELIDQLPREVAKISVNEKITFNYVDFEPRIEIKNVSYKYPGSSEFEIKNLNLTILPGSTLAIVGASGSGKTTFLDIVLGILKPDTGTVEISGVQPSHASAQWSGAISYVPQEVFIASGTLKHNISLGYPKESITEDRIYNAVKIAQLEKYVGELPMGVDTDIGESGTLMSGGQRQRVGIARALYTHPKILVLDEATSSLDAITESKISEEILKLSGQVTLIIVAHRLSTIKSVDKVIYLQEGKITASGSFEEVRKMSKDFDTQAKLMGL